MTYEPVPEATKRQFPSLSVAVTFICGCGSLCAVVFGGGYLVRTQIAAILPPEIAALIVSPTPTATPNPTATPGLAHGTSSPSLVEESPRDMGTDHVQPGDPTPIYSSDPPSSGPHDPNPAPVGFYDTAPSDVKLVHSLEHGDVIIWYDCSKVPGGDCDGLKDDIREVMHDMGDQHLIAVPRSMTTVLCLTSWGKLQRFDTFDVDGMKAFIYRNSNNAPERLDDWSPPQP